MTGAELGHERYPGPFPPASNPRSMGVERNGCCDTTLTSRQMVGHPKPIKGITASEACCCAESKPAASRSTLEPRRFSVRHPSSVYGMKPAQRGREQRRSGYLRDALVCARR